jgi:multidrug efflux pump
MVGRDPDAAAADVRDRVGRIISRLPDGIDQPVVRKVDSNAAAIMWIGVTSTSLDALELTEFMKRVYVDRLATVPGVATVYIGGERRYAMRVWIDRAALAARGLTVQDVESAIRRQNVELPGGLISSSKRELTVKTDSRLSSPAEFQQIIVSNRNGYLVRLGEVARAEVGAEDDRFEFFKDGKPAIGLGIVRQSTANTLAVADAVRKELESLADALPPETKAEVLYDESQFIRASINGVLKTLIEGVALVILVILVFLRDWRSTIVAMVAIPVSVIAAFMVMSFFGASINVLTLLAIVLAIGIVVDDAIVEIENVHRRIEEGQPPLLASFDGAREIGFAVIATTATLMAVFVPLAFMTGNTGRLFREFAIQLAAAIFFSGVVARTLTPMMCSKLMVPAHGPIHRWTEPVFTGMTNGYRWLLSRALRIPIVILALGAVVSFSAGAAVPGAAEGVHACRGPRLHPDPARRPGGFERRLHARSREGGRARDRAARVARVDVEHAEPRLAGLHPPGARQRGPRHRAPDPLGPKGRALAAAHQGAVRLRREFPRGARVSDQPAVPGTTRIPAGHPVRHRRPRL